MATKQAAISKPFFLKCEVRGGMFSDEATVIVRDVNGAQHSFFVPRGQVSGDKVQVIASRGRSGALALIPTGEPSSVVTVSSEDLS